MSSLKDRLNDKSCSTLVNAILSTLTAKAYSGIKMNSGYVEFQQFEIMLYVNWNCS